MESHQEARLYGCDLPRWVAARLGDGAARGGESAVTAGDIEIRIQQADSLALYSSRIEDAAMLDARLLREAVDRAYSLISAQCEARSPRHHPLRYWNFLPGIHEPMEGDLDRYRVFNLGRHDAILRRAGGELTDGILPTATAIGHAADSLVIHCLAGPLPPVNFENPRQIPAYRYSAEYGPRPPCFSRASRASIGGEDVLLVGGTSSVRGERSVHVGDFSLQLEETIENLRSLVKAASVALGIPDDAKSPLMRFKHARAYYVHAEDRACVGRELRRLMPNVEEVDLVQAELCRTELSVEVEGVVELGGE